MREQMNEIATTASPFDAIRRVRPDGSEYWSARELMPLLGYSKWQDFQNAIERAKVAVAAQGNSVTSHFMDSHKVANSGPAQRDVELTRFAAYQVAMSGDPRKPEVAAALAYFAIKTREAETSPQMSQLDVLAQAVATLQEQERRVLAVEATAQRALEEVRAIKPAQRDELYYSGRAWSRLRGVEATLKYLRKLGAKAGVIGRTAGLEPDDVPDERFATVNGWPLWVWDAAYDAIENG